MPPSNDPQISGRNERIIALARVAYLARDLRDLLDAPNTHQMFIYDQANLREMLNLERLAIEQASAFDPSFATLMHELNQWFSDPSTAQELTVKTLIDDFLAIDIDDHIDRLISLIRAGVWGAVYDMWEYWIRKNERFANMDHPVIEAKIEAWQIEVVWAILTDQPIPPLSDPHVPE